MSRRLPPLNAVRAFEATARLGSVALAAAELCVTPGAVSQQISKLEDFYGRELFNRRHHQLLLTDTGQAVFAASADLMDHLGQLTDRILGGHSPTPLVVSVLPLLGSRWLTRHLPDFLSAHPDIRIDLRLEEDPVDFLRTRIDVRLCYGEHLYPDFVTIPFASDRVTPLCAPRWLEQGHATVAEPALLDDSQLIHVQWRTGFSSYPTWDSWFREVGIERKPAYDRGHRADTAGIALDLAEAGLGIVLGQRLFAAAALQRGTLVAPFATDYALPYRYCAVHTPAGLRHPGVRSFLAWLNERALQV